MRTFRILSTAGLLAALGACEDEAFKSRPPGEPPPPVQGAQAFIQVDNDRAAPGEKVQVFVRVQLGTSNQAKIGSYTGRVFFDPQALAWARDVQVNDGMRVVNPADAGTGEVRFAGASAGGFTDLTLYQGEFEVKRADYPKALRLELTELSAAVTLGDLGKDLQKPRQIFLRTQAP